MRETCQLEWALGGAGLTGNPNSVKNIVPMCHNTVNELMKNEIEVPVKNLLNSNTNRVADYRVTVAYTDSAHPAVPGAITVTASVYDCQTGQCTRFSKTYTNQTDLTKCT
jgi:hypothetical protein